MKCTNWPFTLYTSQYIYHPPLNAPESAKLMKLNGKANSPFNTPRSTRIAHLMPLLLLLRMIIFISQVGSLEKLFLWCGIGIAAWFVLMINNLSPSGPFKTKEKSFSNNYRQRTNIYCILWALSSNKWWNIALLCRFRETTRKKFPVIADRDLGQNVNV